MDEQAARGQGAIDPFWVFPTTREITVVMSSAHAVAYQRWLRSQNMHLYLIPETDVYAVGIRWMDGDDRRG